MQDLKSQLKHDSVKVVERHMNETTTDDFLKQRNDKQLDNLKYNINRSRKAPSETSNAADQVISVEEMTKTHPFVKSVKHITGINFPVVTLFTDQKIADIKRFCCREEGSVLCTYKHVVAPTVTAVFQLSLDTDIILPGCKKALATPLFRNSYKMHDQNLVFTVLIESVSEGFPSYF